MGAVGFGNLISSYVLTPAGRDLPFEMTFGTISVSSRIDQPPQATIVYKALTRDRLWEALAAWDIPRDSVFMPFTPETPVIVNLHGTVVALEAASYQRSRYNVGGVYTQLYDLTLQLGSASYVEEAQNPALLDDAQDAALRTGYVIYDSGVPTVLEIGKGNKWSFPTIDVDSASKNRDLVSHNKTEIVLTRRPVAENFYLLEPKLITYWEGDAFPDRPPGLSVSIFDLSNLFDQGGPRKDSKKVEKLDGVTIRETIETWGFLYYTSDSPNVVGIAAGDPTGELSMALDPWMGIPNPPADPVLGDLEYDLLDNYKVSKYRSNGVVERSRPPFYWLDAPEGFPGQPRIWVTVGYRETNYIYEELENVEIEVEIIVPNVRRKGAFIIDPKYKQFVKGYTPGSSRLVLKTRAKYLTEIRETGWDYMRTVAEEFGNDEQSIMFRNQYWEANLFPNGNPMIYRKVPITKVTKYDLASTRFHYDSTEFSNALEKQKVSPPFSIAFVSYVDLDIEQKAAFEELATSEIELVDGVLSLEEMAPYLTPDFKVAVITPDPNYVEPMFPIRERTHETSYIKDLDTITKQNISKYFAKWFASGTENITNVVRTPIVGSQRIQNGYMVFTSDGQPSLWYGYSEYTNSFNAQGGDFTDSRVATASSREVDGLPPEAQIQLQSYVTSAEDPNGFEYEQDRLRYYLTTPDDTSRALTGQSISIDAETIKEAEPIIDLLLKKDIAEKIQAQVTLRWHYPTIAPGDTVLISSEFGSEWIVYAKSWEETYNGKNNPVGKGRTMVTTSGTNLTLGLLKDRGFEIDSSTSGFTTEVAPLVKVTLTDDLRTLTPVLPGDLLGRRIPPV